MSPFILIVDDEPQIRRVMKTALAAEGYSAVDVRSAAEAYQAMRKERFELILLDVNMPGESGLEACSVIRKTSDVAIIMLTVRDADADKVAALDAGADDYVTKPFSMPELLARIRANLRRVTYATAGGPNILQFGSVELNLQTRHVNTQGRDLRFTPKEFDLLYFFVTHPNVTLSHRQILQSVWGPDYGDELSYLHVFVNQIRKKIEPNPAQPQFLLTEVRVGYRFAMQQA